MIQIDKKDELYKYLTNLGVEDVEKEYLTLAQNGRFKLDDVRQYFQETFQPSNTEDVKEEDLEKVLDYYIDLKTVKTLNSKDFKQKLLEYSQTKDKAIREQIINSQLKDILFLCLNYKTLHKDIEVQDLVQMASLGLIEAIEKFNPQARLNFKDYMVYWVRNKIKEEFEEKTNG